MCNTGLPRKYVFSRVGRSTPARICNVQILQCPGMSRELRRAVRGREFTHAYVYFVKDHVGLPNRI